MRYFCRRYTQEDVEEREMTRDDVLGGNIDLGFQQMSGFGIRFECRDSGFGQELRFGVRTRDDVLGGSVRHDHPGIKPVKARFWLWLENHLRT